MAPKEHTDTIRRLFLRGQTVKFEKGDVIFGSDKEPDGVYFLREGFVKAYTISDEGHEYLHLIYGKEELFPLTWAYLGIFPDGMFFESISDSTALRISRFWFLQYLQTDPTMSLALSMHLAFQYHIYNQRVDNLEYKKAGDRIAYRLLFLAYRFGRREGDTIVIEAPITHEVFANTINLARESVSREMERLEKQGIIEKSGNHPLIIKDVKALADSISRPMNFNTWGLL